MQTPEHTLDQLTPTGKASTVGSRVRAWWEKLIAVEHPDPEIARQGRVFNVLMFESLFFVLYLAGTFLTSQLLGLFPAPESTIATVFPLGFVPVSLLCIWQAKRGHVRAMVYLYVWLNLVGLALACLVFDGIRSPAWILFIWTVTMAGTLIRASYALYTTFIIIGYYLALFVLTRLGVYVPLIQQSTPALVFNVLAFSLGVLVTVGGVLTFVNMRSLQATLGQLREAQSALERQRGALEQRVTERTTEIEARAKQFRAIAEINQAVSGMFEIDVMLDSVARLIEERLQYYEVGLYLLTDTRDRLLLKALSSKEGTAGRIGLDFSVQVTDVGDIVGAVAATGRSRVVTRTGDMERYFAATVSPAVHARLTLPLLARGTLIGVLDLQCSDRERFAKDDLEVLRLLADSVAVAIENTRLLQETRSTFERLSRYQEEDVIRGWRRALARRDQDFAFIYDRIMVHEEQADALTDLLPDDVSDIQQLRVIRQRDRYLMLAPIRVQQRTLGVLSFEGKRPWTDDERRLADSVVAQLGLALENARLLEDTRLSAQQERARSEIVGRVRGSVQMDAILRSAAEELGRALNVQRARIQLLPLAERNKPGTGELVE
ncbi:MAG: GAF domain-containing protein [Anaerolineae bacterium]|nr:GAF domain-containing protein [Anaerolineae bacterium]